MIEDIPLPRKRKIKNEKNQRKLLFGSHIGSSRFLFFVSQIKKGENVSILPLFIAKL